MAKYEGLDVFIYANILDPRFKLRWCNNTEEMQEIDLLKWQRAVK